ncbi:MAG: hypothetical protein LUH47_06695 [Clostridiales bacterium]|nr:hypothetical protein [Clostridiales bacterium]
MTDLQYKELEEQGIDSHTADHTRFLPLDIAGEELSLSVDELEELIENDEFYAVTIDGEYYITADYVYQYLKNRA